MLRIHKRELPWLVKEFSNTLTVTQCCSACGVSKLMEELQSTAQEYQFGLGPEFWFITFISLRLKPIITVRYYLHFLKSPVRAERPSLASAWNCIFIISLEVFVNVLWENFGRGI